MRRWSLALLALTTLASCHDKGEQTPARPTASVTAGSALTQPGWQPTGSMTQSRLEYTATLLGSGKVLVAGGYSQTAELYDAASGAWTATANSLAIRNNHSATLLGNGQVLLAGGEFCQSSSSAELFNPVTAQWSLTGGMITCRKLHVALTLASGQVLVVGGADNSGTPLASAELYDPATGTWTATGAMGTARTGFTATRLPSGKVLVTGGSTASSTLLASAELYDPATGTWTTTGALSLARGFHSATLLPSGKVLVAGGGGSNSTQAASAELYDSVTGSWTATGSMVNPRRYHAATLLPSGQVLVSGGYHEATGIQYDAELYDGATGTWSATASMNVDRYGHSALLLSTGSVLVAGGVSNHGSSSAELYTSAAAPPAGPREPQPTPIDLNRFTPLAEAIEFLYSGPNAIQLGVQPGTIDPERVAVLRGVVKTRQGTSLEGVRVSISGQPQYGHTLTRADGRFDLAVNGGGALTVDYTLEGYLPAQRQVKPDWASYAWLPDVRLIPVDNQVTTITLNGSATGFQSAQGSVTTDADGTRQATVLFPPDTVASLVLPNGSTQPLSMLHVRATEYTVGAQGPETMPGELPPASGYTYAVELSVDEAAGAEVRFSKPVYLYVDNFLGFPVGGTVPSGWYDRQAGAWHPSDNGRIVKLLGVTAGLADLDGTGDGIADTSSELTALGVTDAERQRLATLFAPGQSFWRAPIPHFTPWDLNWPFDFPWNAKKPNQKLKKQDQEKDSDLQCGSIIDCQNQVLGESASVVGTPFQLSYRSNRVPAFRNAQPITIPLADEDLPDTVSSILVQVDVAGQRHLSAFDPIVGSSTTFQWDGKDGFGRFVQGVFPVTIQIGYVYGLRYLSPFGVSGGSTGGGSGGGGGGGPVFAQFAASDITSNRNQRTAVIWQKLTTSVGTWVVPTTQLGGWTLDVHHTYDPVSQTLYLGNGEQHTTGLTSNNPILSTEVGDGDFGHTGDGAAARKARLWNPHDIAFAPDGTLYIADTYNNRVRRVDPGGTITTLAGSEEYQPRAVAVGPDGSVYVSHPALHCIRKVSPGGASSAFAGTCGFSSNGSSGDEGPATSARLSYPQGIALGKEGNLYIADFDNDRVRYVTPEGIIHTLAGKPNGRGFCGDEGFASEACLNGPWDVAVGADGDVYVSDTANHRVRHIGVNGRITTVAGTGADGSLGTSIGDGGRATQAQLSAPKGLALDAAGNLYIADHVSRVRRVDANGIITTFAGQLQLSGFAGNGVPALQGQFDSPAGLAVSPSGALYVSDEWNHSVRRVGYPGAFIREGEAWVGSRDGRELYVFTQKEGRHMRTLDALTQVVRFEFGYDADARLVSITDQNGLVTHVERDSTTGKPTALVAPHGQRTPLESDANGYLSAIANPANERIELTHSFEGLLTQLRDARQNIHTYEYTSAGRLRKDSNAVGGSKLLTQTIMTDGYKVAVETAMGRRTTFQVTNLGSGGQLRTTILPSGEVSASLRRNDGTALLTNADGTVTTQTYVPDPRLGSQSPFIATQRSTLPSGLARQLSHNRAVTFATQGDILSLATLTSSLTVNGFTSTSTYDTATRTRTTRSFLGRETRLMLDAKGRVARRETPGLLPIVYGFSAEGRVESITQGTRTSNFAYNPQGYLQTRSDALSRSSSMSYDSVGRVVTSTLPSSRTVEYGYDANGNLSSLKPPGRDAHVFTYTPAEQEQDYTPPALSGSPALTSTSLYNLDGQPVGKHYPDGSALSIGYEDTATSRKGRISTLTLTTPPGGRYAASTRQVSYYPGSGYVKDILDSRGPKVSYQYDGHLVTHVTWSGAVQGSVAYGHDDFFRLSSVSVAAGPTQSFVYDNDGLLTQVGALSISRDSDNGLMTGTSLGQVSTVLSHNAYGEADEQSAFFGTSPLFSLQLGRDAAGRLQEKQETIQGVTHDYSYAYDAAGRLFQVMKDGTLLSTAYYDSNGNRTAIVRAGSSHSATHDTQDRLLVHGSSSYTYGANGDLQYKHSGSALTSYTYDALGNLLSVQLPDGTLVGYVIDPQQRRVGKRINGVLTQGFLYDGQLRIIAELNGDNQVVSRFVYASRAQVPDYMVKGGTTYRILADDLGSPRLIVDTNTGSIAQRLDYDVWGNVLADTMPGFQPFGFAGGLYDTHTGLIRFGARDYDPDTGRWTNKDPVRFGGGDTNLYAYAGNDPVNQIDPSGLYITYISPELQPVVDAVGSTFIGGTYLQRIKDSPVPVSFKTQDDYGSAGRFMRLGGLDFSRTTGVTAAQRQMQCLAGRPNQRGPVVSVTSTFDTKMLRGNDGLFFDTVAHEMVHVDQFVNSVAPFNWISRTPGILAMELEAQMETMAISGEGQNMEDVWAP